VDCTLCDWECDPGSCPGADYYFVSGLRVVSHTVTVTDPEATVSSSVNCSVWGDASWCTQPANTVITAHEPMPANQILLIEGTRNGETFACSGTSCTVPMLEGSNGLTYWAISDYGDSSRLGTRTVLQDTQAPQINASLSGTAGQNGWFVSPAELTVIFSDPLPGSGLVATSALINGTLTDVSHPVTLIEGVYAVVLDVRDAAGLTAQASQTVYVDTTAPALTPQQPQAEVNGYMNGSVIFRGTVSDATSGVRTVLVTVDGVNWDTATLNTDGTWVLDWNSVGMTDGVYTPRAAAVDNAGNRTEISLQAINLDNSPPGMSMTNAWYIWESGHLRVEDNRSGIQRIQLSVRDDQNRWPAMIWEYEVPVLERDLQWNRRFADGTTAPIGSYEVLLQAWDKLGNESWLTARIYIPAAGATPPIPPQTILTTGGETPTAVPTQQGTQPVAAAMVSPTRMPTTEPALVTMSFSSVPDEPAGIIANKQDGETTKNSAVDPNILWGAAAVSAAAGAAAYALQKKKEREAARKAAEEAERDAAYAKVAAYEERKKQNYLQKVYAERRRAAEALYAKRMGKVEDVELGPEEAPIPPGLEKARDVVLGPEDPPVPMGLEKVRDVELIPKNSKNNERYEQMKRMQKHYAASIAAHQKNERKDREREKILSRYSSYNDPNQAIDDFIAGLPDHIDAIELADEVDSFVEAFPAVQFVERGGNIIIYGTQGYRVDLHMNPYTNRISPENVGQAYYNGIGYSLHNQYTSPLFLVSIGANVVTNGHDLSTGEIDRYEFGASLAYDTANTIITATVAGAAIGFAAGFAAGFVPGIPGLLIGAGVGLVVGIGTSIGMSALIDLGKEWYVETVANYYRDL